MGDHILPADPAGNDDQLRTYTMGILSPAEMGRCMGEVVDKVSNSTLLWSDALFCGILCATAI